jgi:glycosyltransferase involved in cell wall biosynthesis
LTDAIARRQGRRVRVLLLGETARFHNGGANRVVVETCAWLARAGHEVALAYQHGGPVEVACPTFELPEGGTTAQLMAVLDEFRPDVVQVHHVARPERLPDLASRVPTCVFLHDQTWFCLCGDRADRNLKPCHRPHGVACLFWNYAQGCGAKNPQLNLSRWKRTQRLTVLKSLPSVRIQVASRFMTGGLRENGYDGSRVDVVPLFAEPPPAEAAVEPGLVLLPSRLVPAKGVQVALDAMAELKALPWRLVVAGDGWYRTPLEAQARRLGIAERVTFLGEVVPAQLADWYARAQLVLFPVLRQEPFGLIGVEALAYGRPIVAFAGGAVDEWLWPGETGLRVDERSATAFASSVRGLLGDPARCAAMGEAAKRRYPRFHPTAYIERLVTSFEGTRRWAALKPASGPGR